MSAKIFDIIPYSTEKNLGKAYNEAMELIPDDGYACFRDGDTMWLTPDYGMLLAKYVYAYPDAVLTCWTNRIHELAKGQLDKTAPNNDNITEHILHAKNCAQTPINAEPVSGPVSGFLMVVPKKVWLLYKFTEVQVYEKSGPHNLLGVDNDYTNRIRAAGIPVLRMNSIYIFHSYRLLDGSKKHLT